MLIYPELGMDARCMVLAALRLAPVQCAAWGHPVTSGHGTIDRFHRAEAMEPAGGDAHYVESWRGCQGIGTASAARAIGPAGRPRAPCCVSA
ncbi:MAG: hypothetical protein IPI73_04865 [Betaproteobacteria bacterium]|nr:hypothetical protein [Betaproteobacteria bacterium]